MDAFIRKIPLLNMPFAVLVMLFGTSNPKIVSVIIGLTFLSASAIFYKIRVDDYKKLINPKRYLITVTCIALLISCAVYFDFGQY